MKILLYIFLGFSLMSFGQGEQLYADGTDVDQDGNTFEWINYGTYDWSIENAEMVTYRDGTPIPQVEVIPGNYYDWGNLTTGAWTYYLNNPAYPKVYNWYAVMGIHDNDPNTANKEFAPDGWHVPSIDEWTNLEEYLIANGYNYDGSTDTNTDVEPNLIGKAMASATGWITGYTEGAIGLDQSTNNSSGFNAFPVGVIGSTGNSTQSGNRCDFWSSTEGNGNYARITYLDNLAAHLYFSNSNRDSGKSVRFVRDSNPCINDPVTAICNEIEITLEEGYASININDIDGGSYGCGETELEIYYQDTNFGSQFTFDSSNLGENIIQLMVTDSSGNSTYCDALITVLAGMSLEESNLNVFLYPNPTSDLVFIGGVDSELNAVVYDLLGKQVTRKYITKKIDISILEKGVYFVRLSNGINNSVHKIIKN